MKLILQWPDFTSQIEALSKESDAFANQINNAKTESEINEVNDKIKKWAGIVKDFIRNSFDPLNEDDSREFFYAAHTRFNSPNLKKSLTQLQKEAKEDVNAKRQFLEYYVKILSIADAIIYPDKFNYSRKLDTEAILNLILEKLYDLDDGRYHPIGFILEGNDVILKNNGEDRELIKTLEMQGLVESLHTRNVNAQITIQGKLYVESRRRTYVEDYDDIDESALEMNQKVDEILERLTKLGYGQEIIFNEIDELKDLYTKLNKKTWAQVVKGKLVDLALAKLVENDTLEYIYNHLTSHSFHLPK